MLIRTLKRIRTDLAMDVGVVAIAAIGFALFQADLRPTSSSQSRLLQHFETCDRCRSEDGISLENNPLHCPEAVAISQQIKREVEAQITLPRSRLALDSAHHTWMAQSTPSSRDGFDPITADR